MMGWLAIASLLLRNTDLVWIFFFITLLGIFTGTAYSLPTLFYRFVKTVFKFDLIRVSSHHARYYEINSSIDFIDHLLRLIASGAALGLFYAGFAIPGWLMMSFLSVFMMLSAYFGFCLSALSFIGLESIRARFGNESSALCEMKKHEGRHFNQNCILAKRCFTPYKRCDSCHIGIKECLGTKFNTLIIIIGLLMSLFLFIDKPVFVHINIIVIMGLIFWLGYQINYSTDALAESNNANKLLYSQLERYTQSLEAEVQRRTAEIEHLATHDMLTELYNRFSFEGVLEKALGGLKKAEDKHLAFIDLDRFKHINDTAGHLAGDKLLQNIANILKESIGEKGTLARIGGDEFAVLFEGLTQQEAFAICNKVCETVKNYTFSWHKHQFEIGASIGLATLKPSMQDIKAALHHADEACYRAKKAGKGQVVIYN